MHPYGAPSKNNNIEGLTMRRLKVRFESNYGSKFDLSRIISYLGCEASVVHGEALRMLKTRQRRALRIVLIRAWALPP